MLYALGEIILVVIGIMIAIQINNANQKHLDQDALQGYLNSIGQNIKSDLQKAEKINNIHLELFPRISLSNRRMMKDYYQIRSEVYGDNISADYLYSVENIDFVSKTINDAWQTRYLTPNLSGFESLKSSGFLNQLQGSDLETLLFDYYSLIDDLTTRENNYNSNIQNAYEDFINAGLPGTYAFFNASSQDWKTKIGKPFNGMMDEILQHPTLIPIFVWPYDIIIKYENLLVTGQTLHEMITKGEKTFSPEIRNRLANVYDEYEEAPYPKIMRAGHMTKDYGFATACAFNDQGVNLQFLGSFSAIQFKSEPWAVAYFFIGSGVVDPNRVKDFSKFKILQLKLRGTKGGEHISIGLKDISNPTDGSETKIPLTLTNNWKTYEIPLTSFAPTRLEELFISTSIIVENQAITIEIDSIEFL